MKHLKFLAALMVMFILISATAVAKTETKENAKKQERWSKIVLNAAQQCEVRWLPELKQPLKMDAVLATLFDYDLVLIGSLYEGTQPFREVEMAGKTAPSARMAASSRLSGKNRIGVSSEVREERARRRWFMVVLQ